MQFIKRKIAALFLVFFGILYLTLYFTQSTFAANSAKKVKDTYIVVFKNNVKNPKSNAEAMAKEHGLKLKYIYSSALKGYSAVISSDKLDKIKKDQRVLFVRQDEVIGIEARGGVPGKPKPTLTPTKTPTPSPTTQPSPSPTNIPTPTPISGIGLITNPTSVDMTVMAGTSVKVFDLTSTGATGFILYGYPTTYGAGINWNPSSGGIAVNSTMPVDIQVNYGIASGVYTGTGILKNSSSTDQISIPIKVTVIDNPNGPIVKILNPNGGESLTVGQTYRITWSSTNVSTVNIGYSACSSCLDWIATGVPNTGYYDWNVNVGNTTNTQFKIDLTGYMPSVGSSHDQSDNYFTVLQLQPTSTPTPTPTPFSEAPSGVKRIGLNNMNKGTGIVVAVLDTGIDLTHSDLSENIVGHVDCMNPSQNPLPPDYDCISGVTSGNDDNGHGTHVAGTIAAVENNNGVRGVAPEAKLIAVKVLAANGYGTWSSVIAGINFVTSHAQSMGIKIVNMSLGGGGTSDNNCGLSNMDPIHMAICNSRDAGITYIVAAMNNSQDASYGIPAAYDDAVITVSALADFDGLPGGLAGGNDDTFASFSNYGSVVDLAGPGVNIYSTYVNGGYRYLSGTSMATPHVVGASALYLKSYPGASWNQLRDALKVVAEPLGSGHTDPSGLHPEPLVKTASL